MRPVYTVPHSRGRFLAKDRQKYSQPRPSKHIMNNGQDSGRVARKSARGRVSSLPEVQGSSPFKILISSFKTVEISSGLDHRCAMISKLNRFFEHFTQYSEAVASELA